MNILSNETYYLWLSLVPRINCKIRKILLDAFGSPLNIYNAKEEELAKYVSDEKARIINNNKNIEEAKKYENQLLNKGIGYISIINDNYPEQLRDIYDPPIVLFYRGNIKLLNNVNCIGIVGSRVPSVYGIEVAKKFAYELAKAGIIVVSGLAEGIDRCSHLGAISTENGHTIGVLGSGINVCYPQNNFGLYNDMCQNQLIISENGLDVTPKPYLFPLRNRIISGLSKAVLVVEAKSKSGSLITADSALDQNKEVYAIPGRVTDKLSEGTNNLIKMGARLVTTPEEIISDLLPHFEQKSINLSGKLYEQQEKELAPLEKIVYSDLSLEPKYIDNIVDNTGFSVTEVISALLALENKKLIKQPVRGYYIVAL